MAHTSCCRLSTLSLIIILMGNLEIVQSAINLKIDGTQVYGEPSKLVCSTSTINTVNYGIFYRSTQSGQSGTLVGYREVYPNLTPSCREGTVQTNYTVSCNSDGSMFTLTIPANNTIEHRTYWRCQTETDRSVLANNVINMYIIVKISGISLISPVVGPDNMVNVRSEVPTTFQCQTTQGRPVANITWYLDNVLLSGGTTTTTPVSGDIVITTGSLTLTVNRTADDTVLSCRATNYVNMEPVESAVKPVIRVKLPQANVSLLGGQVALKGSNAQLVCSIADYGFQQETRWRVPSTVSGNSDVNVVQCIGTTCISGPARVSRYTYSRDTSGMYLNISNLNRDVDQKLWKCVLQETNPIVTSELNLIVVTSPEAVTYTQPVIVSQDLTVSSVTLVAASTNCSYPAPVFKWYYLENNSRMVYSSNSRTSSTTKGKEDKCQSPERIYISTLTLPRYTTFEGNVHKTAIFQCGISHPALSEETFTPLSDTITFAVRVTRLFLKDGNTTLTAGASVEAVVGTKKTLDVVWFPANSSPRPTLSCYVGVIVTVLPGSVLTFTVLEHLDGNEIYCTANNTDLNAVSSIKANLNVIAQLTMITLKDGNDNPHSGQDIELQEGTHKQLTVEVAPAEGLALVTIYCYLGKTSHELSKGTRIFSFMTKSVDHGKSVYCKANNIGLDHYKFTQAVKLKVIGKPEPPSFLISRSPGTNSASLFWLPGYHGDADQTFHIDFRRVNGSWVKGPDVLGGQIQGQLFNVTVSDLKTDTRYEFRIFASSSLGSRDLFKYDVTRTLSAIVICTCSPCNNIGAAVGGSVGGIAAVVVISVFVVWYCRKTGKSERPDPKKSVNRKRANTDSSQNDPVSEYYNIGSDIEDRQTTDGSSCYQDLTNRGPVVVPVYQTMDVVET